MLKKYMNHNALLVALGLFMLSLPSIEATIADNSSSDFVPLYEIQEDGQERFIRYVPVVKEYVPNYPVEKTIKKDQVASADTRQKA